MDDDQEKLYASRVLFAVMVFMICAAFALLVTVNAWPQ